MSDKEHEAKVFRDERRRREAQIRHEEVYGRMDDKQVSAFLAGYGAAHAATTGLFETALAAYDGWRNGVDVIGPMQRLRKVLSDWESGK